MTEVPPTLLEIVKKTSEFFAGKGIESPRLNAELLIGHALGLKRMQLYLQFERNLTAQELDLLRGLVRRRGQREPLQYIVGSTDFHGITLKVDRRALIPRPETEGLVEAVRTRLSEAPSRILDLGTGSGAIALSLATLYPEAAVIAVDRSPEALALAKENTEALGLGARVSLRQSDWFSAVADEAPFPLIVSNPPYLSEEETKATTPEVRGFEPLSALASANAGLADLERLLREAPGHLATGGLLALETGIAQHAALKELAARAGLVDVESLPDLTGRDRYIVARR